MGKIITFCYIYSQGLELLCESASADLGAVQWSLANRMRDFYTRDRTPRGPKRLEAKRYEGNVKEGNLLIAVHTNESTERARAKDICMRAGAEDISYTEEARV